MNLHFYYCEICGKIVTVLNDNGMPTDCCGQNMTELMVNTVDATVEKHLPVYAMEGNVMIVRVGSAAHPMEDVHHIEWVGLRTANGFQFQTLRAGDEPKAVFLVRSEDPPEAVYAYCNLHGLWGKEV